MDSITVKIWCGELTLTADEVAELLREKELLEEAYLAEMHPTYDQNWDVPFKKEEYRKFVGIMFRNRFSEQFLKEANLL